MMKHRYLGGLACLFLFLLSSTPSTFAQQAGDQNSLLPEIDPQDIEIRSEFRARFPGLRRQPILGFNPRPRVFRIDPNRLPFMETKDEVVANLPVSQLDRPTAPINPGIGIPNRNYGFVSGGIGTYTSPEAEAYFGSRVSEKTTAFGSLDYRSSDGHLDNQNSSFRFFGFDVGLRSQVQDNSIFDAQVYGRNDFHYMPEPNAGDDVSQKNYNYVGTNISYTSYQNSLENWKVSAGLDFTNIDHTVNPNIPAALTDGTVNELWFNGGFELNKTGNKLFETYSLFADLEVGAWDFTGFESTALLDAKAGIRYNRLFESGTKVNAVAAGQVINDGINTNIYIAPELSLRQSFQEKFIINAKAYGRPELITQREHNEMNRFLTYLSTLKQSYAFGADGNIRLEVIPNMNLYGGVNYEFINNYNFYNQVVLTNVTGTIGNTFTVNNADASIFKIYSGITQQFIPDVFWLNAELYARSPQFSGGGTIPFEEKVGLSGSLSLRPINAILVEGWVDYVGERESAVGGGSSTLDAFVLVNAKVEAEILDNFGAYIKSLNLLDNEYQLYSGYTERPFQLFVGVTYKF